MKTCDFGVIYLHEDEKFNLNPHPPILCDFFCIFSNFFLVTDLFLFFLGFPNLWLGLFFHLLVMLEFFLLIFYFLFDYFQVISGAKKLGEKSCPYFDDLSELFSGGGASYQYGETSTFRLEDSDTDKEKGGGDDAISLGDDDDDTPMTAKSSGKRSAHSGASSQGKEGSRASKKSKGESSTIADTLKLINSAQQARIDSYRKDPAEQAAQVLRDMNLDRASFVKAFAWISQSKHQSMSFLGLSDELRCI